jgi:hypothetical protein
MATTNSQKTSRSIKSQFQQETLRQYKRVNILYISSMVGVYGSTFVCVVLFTLGQAQASAASGVFGGATLFLTDIMNKSKKDQHDQMELMISASQPKRAPKNQSPND